MSGGEKMWISLHQSLVFHSELSMVSHMGNWSALLFQVSRPWLPWLRVCFSKIVFYSRYLSFVSVVDKNKYM